ncbi:hypothetical protein [Micromonospora sp. RP3T]|uniref:hypothetical protein n=1 Tax=Micromonospora sp. RP3T TaxID=2135446 RepID=UPI0011B29972|nr:hypothetical protein [Micromonospora sp. RP3T]
MDMPLPALVVLARFGDPAIRSGRATCHLNAICLCVIIMTSEAYDIEVMSSPPLTRRPHEPRLSGVSNPFFDRGDERLEVSGANTSASLRVAHRAVGDDRVRLPAR